MQGITDSVDVLTEMDNYEEYAVGFGGFMAGTVTKNTVERFAPFDVPDEAYGLAVVVLAQMFISGDGYRKAAQMGGGLYTADKAAERFGIKTKVQEAV